MPRVVQVQLITLLSCVGIYNRYLSLQSFNFGILHPHSEIQAHPHSRNQPCPDSEIQARLDSEIKACPNSQNLPRPLKFRLAQTLRTNLIQTQSSRHRLCQILWPCSATRQSICSFARKLTNDIKLQSVWSWSTAKQNVRRKWHSTQGIFKNQNSKNRPYFYWSVLTSLCSGGTAWLRILPLQIKAVTIGQAVQLDVHAIISTFEGVSMVSLTSAMGKMILSSTMTNWTCQWKAARIYLFFRFVRQPGS